MENNTVYIVIPFFNFTDNEVLYHTYKNTLNRLNKTKGIEVYTGEVLFPHQKESLIKDLNKNHVVFRMSNPYILMHNLCNVVIEYLPYDWKYVVILDNDIEFVNEDWVDNIINALNSYSFITPYKEAIRLDAKGNEFNRVRSFGYMYHTINENKHRIVNGYFSDRLGGWWPGYAMSFTREFYDNVGGVYDKNISGKNDVVTTACIANKVDNLNIYEKNNAIFKSINEYKNKVLAYTGFKGVGYADNLIRHHYHGKYSERNYNVIEKIIIDNSFDPNEDFYIHKNGLYELKTETLKQQKLVKELVDYFNNRTQKEKGESS